jgi:cephalosporin hydroxylase
VTSEFEAERRRNILDMSRDLSVKTAADALMDGIARHKYTYNFNWFGLPILQLPTDLVAMQEIIWETRPRAIVETGIARGGSLIFYASMLRLLNSKGHVVGVDIDIREQQRKMIETHPLFDSITLIEGSSISAKTIQKVKAAVQGMDSILVVLDSNHAHDHVLAELHGYSDLVRKGGYLVVFDTVIADMPEETLSGRPWSRERNPKTAVHQFLSETSRFEIDKDLEAKLILTNAPDGFLRCVAD